MNVWLSLLIMFLVIYSVRMIPMILLRRNITNPLIRSFLYYVPYVTLAVMTFPAIVEATASPIAGVAALAVGVVAAYLGGSLLTVAGACCAVVFLLELILV